MKKIIVWALIATMLLSGISFGVAKNVKDGHFIFNHSDEDEATIIGYSGTDIGDLVIPATLHDPSVTSNAATVVDIAYGAFAGKEINTLTIPSSVKVIHGSAFNNSDIESVTLPKGIKHLDSFAFLNNKITNIELPAGITYIGSGVFKDNAITSVILGDSNYAMSSELFANNQIVSVTFDDNIRSLGSNMFADNQISSIDLPEKITYLSTGVFMNNQLTHVTLPDELGNMSSNVFKNNQLETIDFSKKIYQIGPSAFENNKLNRIQLPDAIDYIGDKAFAGNKLDAVELPYDVREIGLGAFSNNNISSFVLPEGKLGYDIVWKAYDEKNALIASFKTGDRVENMDLRYIADRTPKYGGYFMIEGYPIEGDVLTVVTTNLKNPPVEGDFLFQWYHNDKAIEGERDVTYCVKPSDTGVISVEIRHTIDSGQYRLNNYYTVEEMEKQFTKVTAPKLASVATHSIVLQDGAYDGTALVKRYFEFYMSEGGKIVESSDENFAEFLKDIDFDPTQMDLEYILVESGKTIKNAKWQDSPTFTGLSSGVTYDIYRRTKKIELAENKEDGKKRKIRMKFIPQSPVSEKLMVITLEPQSSGGSSNDDDDNDNDDKKTTSSSSSTLFNKTSKSTVEKQVGNKVVVKATVTKNNLGKATAKGHLEEKAVTNKLKTLKEKQSVVVEMQEDAEDIELGISMGAMTAMKEKKSSLEVKSRHGDYVLPSASIQNDQLNKIFDVPVDISKVELKVKISEPSTDVVKTVKDQVKNNGVKLLVEPVSFEVEATYGGKTKKIEDLKVFATRTLPLPENMDISTITTAVVVEADGSLRPVPMTIVTIAGKHYAKISSVTNSIYTVIGNKTECVKIKGHWAEKEMQAAIDGLIIPQALVEVYNPNDVISRSDFTKLLAKSLGLKQEEGTQFTDLKDMDKSGYIYAAYNHGLIKGTGKTTFSPNAPLTREQAVTILHSVLALTDKEVTISENNLVTYKDKEIVATYAKTALNWAVQEKILGGKSKTHLAPKDEMTCAEAIVLVERLMKALELK